MEICGYLIAHFTEIPDNWSSLFPFCLLALKVGMLNCPVRDMILVENGALLNNYVPLGTRYGWCFMVSLTGHRFWEQSRFYQYHVPNGTKTWTKQSKKTKCYKVLVLDDQGLIPD